MALLALFSIRAPARVRAADFSAPYDPDFATPEQKQAPLSAPVDEKGVPVLPTKTDEGGGEAAEKPVRVLIPRAKPFLLFDRSDSAHIFEQALSTAPAAETPTFTDFQKTLKPFRYDASKYNVVREKIEQGIEPGEDRRRESTDYVTPLIGVSTTTAPRPPPPELELPTYGTSLSVTGRKIIGFQFQEKRFLNDQTTTGRQQTTNLITIDQQLQLRMQGKVGPKITVNVDYDDTKLNKQDISVVYTGDPNEVVQNVSFGDIDLSLPATEFVSYNKQLFGIRADVKYKGLKASFIGSRTKGTTKSRQFSGNTQFVATDLLDTSYVRRQYYDITFGLAGRLPIQAGSERIFLSQNSAQQVQNANNVQLTVDDLQVPSSTFTGIFNQLNPGLDYTIDYARGIVKFTSPLLQQMVVAVDFVDNSGQHIAVESDSDTFTGGGTGRFKLIKTPSDVQIATTTEVGWYREMKTFYSIGQTQIVRDNGRGNFILRVLNQQRTEIGSGLNPPQTYPETINVDFENGVFQLLQPFSVSNSSPTTPDPEIYAFTPISKRLLHVEYSFRFKTFFLEPNLVSQSEIVLLDNQKLNRNVDYFIDYEAGFITFFNEDRIHANSTIDISYELAPFIGATNESLLGTRVSYDFNKHVTIGTTLLYQAGAKSPTVPSVTELARSLLVYDFDTRISEIKLGKKLKLVNLAAEIAQSRQNPNLNSNALVDNMEGIKQEDSASTLATSWQLAAQAPAISATSPGTPVNPNNVTWFSEDVPVLTINPNAQANTQESQKVLDLQYSNLAVNEEVSLVFPFAQAGVDMSQKTILEVVMLGDNSLNEINFRLGGVSEDADGRGGTNDADGSTLLCTDGRVLRGVPKTEDSNCDGNLKSEEDIGWLYNAAVGQTQRFIPNNGRLDTEDLDADGKLDADDGFGNNFGFGRDLTGFNTQNGQLFSATDNAVHTNINYGGNGQYHVFQIPLQISTATVARWNNIKNVRITVRRTAGGLQAGTLKFARIAAVGNTWLRGTNIDPATGSGPVRNEQLTATPVNNVDNPTYVPIFNAGGDASSVFNDLYGGVGALQKQSNTKNIAEQALQLEFSSMTITGGNEAVVTTKRLFSRAIDLSQHRFFNFLVFGNADFVGQQCAAAAPTPGTNPDCSDHTFFLRAGNDTNFFEVRLPINFVGWKKVSIRQADTRGDSIANNWALDTPGVVIITSGTPNLQQVANIVVGVRRPLGGNGSPGGQTPNAAATETRGRLWVNEIHVSQPITRVGNARKVEMAFEVPGWATFGGKYRFIDRNFQTPTTVVSGQDNRLDTGYMNFTRIRSFPMNFTLQRQIVDTPSTIQTGNLSNLVNLLQQGKVTTWTGTAQGNFALGAYPRLSLGHTRNRIEYELLTRLDDRKTFNGSLQYGVPINSRFLPRSIDLSASRGLYDVTFQRPDVLRVPGNFNTFERSQSYAARMTFVPWTGSSFNPTYSITRVSESREDFTRVNSPTDVSIKYDKSMTQSAGFSSNYRINRWLNPQVNYQVDIIENNILNISTFVVRTSTFVFGVGDIKTVNRSANGSISLPLTIAEIFPKTRLFRSMNIINGYQIQDGDVWSQVEKGLNTQGALWLRTPLRATGPAVQRINLTLRDTFNSTQRWSPLEAYDIGGRWSPIKTLQFSNNYVRSIQRNEVTGTPSRTIATTLPDLVASISQLEKLVSTQKWMSNTQMTYRYAVRKTETIGQQKSDERNFGSDLRTIIRKRFDTLLSYNTRNTSTQDLLVNARTQNVDHQDATVQVTFDVRKFRFTPKTDYTHDVTTLGTGVKTQDLTVITPSLLVRADLSLPRGLLLPGSTKTILFSNRIIWTSTVSLARRRSPVVQADNSDLFSLNTSGDYEIAKNLRMTLNGAASRLWHKFLKAEEFISYQFGTTLTFQF